MPIQRPEIYTVFESTPPVVVSIQANVMSQNQPIVTELAQVVMNDDESDIEIASAMQKTLQDLANGYKDRINELLDEGKY